MKANIDIPSINNDPLKNRVNSNNNIFERDVQSKHNYNSPRSPTSISNKLDEDIDPKSSCSNPFLSFKSPNKKSPPVLNENFTFECRGHSDNQLAKVPTHVLTLDDYINSDMDEKCYITTVHKHCQNKNCDTCKKYDSFETDKECCDDFTERMDYFNHRQSSFDQYFDESKKKSLSNESLTSPNLRTLANKNESDSDNDIKFLTAELIKNSLTDPSTGKDDKSLNKEDFEQRRLSRERSRSLTSIIVKGLSDSC